ncbi:hypothetical protein QFC20_007539 [Naganishia adeliensis]|uniref:Uncharacterized protein n=1 Tax=Naganishia adeliensis TaxID=92952 RepID=A0ACC2UXJ7_9TREE|nr:hypothetical protein QFC20_007539 [Naganishia adeliensis]
MTPITGEFSGGVSATATSITHDSARDHLESASSSVFPQSPSLPDDDSLPLQSDEEGADVEDEDADVEEDGNENL